VPSLINKSTILDLTPETSFVEYLKLHGMRPLILDWGSPGEDEAEFSTSDYITAYALDALQTLREQHEGPIVLLGYCMGGIFTVAMAQLAPLFIDGLILLATPWDFSAEDTPHVLLNPATQLLLKQWIGAQNPVPPMVTQTLFHLIDPWRVQEKYQRYPSLSAEEKQQFLAIEHWVNDGVPLTKSVAEECFVDWPQGNILAHHQWKVGRRWIEPETIKTPTLAVIPTRDKIVPQGCAIPLSAALPRCEVIEPESGHISMLVGRRAPHILWEPLKLWIEGKF
jgi:poly(3-hydroxyalkanoate) synthetase